MMNAHLQSGFKQGYLKPLLGRIYSLEDAAQAQTDVISNSGTCGRLTLKIWLDSFFLRDNIYLLFSDYVGALIGEFAFSYFPSLSF